LFCELSDRVRAIGVIEGNIVFQSIDNKGLSTKRLDFTTRIAEKLSDKAYFVEGSADEILNTAESAMQ